MPGGFVFHPHRGVAARPRCWRVGWVGGAAGPATAGCARGADRALEQEKRQLEQELAKARFVVEVQAKLHALLETISESEQPQSGSTT